MYIPAEDPGASARQQILAVFDALSQWTAAETFRGCPFVNTATELADPGHPARLIARDYKLRLRTTSPARPSAARPTTPSAWPMS
jgi:hypothetical protein